VIGKQRRTVRRARLRRNGLLPSALIVIAFAAAIGVGTLLLALPWSHEPGARPRLLDCLFTSVSAITVTGLATVDTSTTWSAFGEGVVLVLIQLGGLGMIASATLMMLLINRRLDITTRMAAMEELPGSTLGGVRVRLWFLLRLTFTIEATMTVLLTLVFLLRYNYGFGQSLWYGLFHTVSAFNNAGFALFSDGLIGFASDPFILGSIALAIILGGLGLPVFLDLHREPRRISRWSVHTKLTLATTALLLVLGTVGFLLFEDPAVGSPTGSGLLNSAFASVTARTAGFNSIDYGAVSEESILLTCFLMIIGGGSASTAGGIKVTTFIILILVVIAEARGSRDVNVGDRRMSHRAIRTALAVTVSYAFLIAFGVMSLLATSDDSLSSVLFETVSAVATVGLSTGITPDLGTPALVVLMLLMFAGRLGALTLASAFALRRTDAPYRLPEGQPFIG
jgi:potassium uptake TrkH family protein